MGQTYFVPGTGGSLGPGSAQGETLPGGTLRLRLGDLEVFRENREHRAPRPHRAPAAPGFRGPGGVKFRTSEAQESTGQLSDDSERLGYSSAKYVRLIQLQ